jgi:hypothetical protein
MILSPSNRGQMYKKEWTNLEMCFFLINFFFKYTHENVLVLKSTNKVD